MYRYIYIYVCVYMYVCVCVCVYIYIKQVLKRNTKHPYTCNDILYYVQSCKQ